jgi:hypothetical protein
MKAHNIVFLQETWARDETNFNIKKDDFKIYHRSSMKDDYTIGRPYGGIA